MRFLKSAFLKTRQEKASVGFTFQNPYKAIFQNYFGFAFWFPPRGLFGTKGSNQTIF